ncbi:unnamed protein product [Ixodes pacificus]
MFHTLRGVPKQNHSSLSQSRTAIHGMTHVDHSKELLRPETL